MSKMGAPLGNDNNRNVLRLARRPSDKKDQSHSRNVIVSRNVGSLCDEFRSFASGHGSNASEMNAGSGEVMASNLRNVSR